MEKQPSDVTEREPYIPLKGDLLTFTGDNGRKTLKVLKVDYHTEKVVLTDPDPVIGRPPTQEETSISRLQELESEGNLKVRANRGYNIKNLSSDDMKSEPYIPLKGDLVTFLGKNGRKTLKVLKVDYHTEKVVLTDPDPVIGRPPTQEETSISRLQELEAEGELKIRAHRGYTR